MTGSHDSGGHCIIELLAGVASFAALQAALHNQFSLVRPVCMCKNKNESPEVMGTFVLV